MTGKLYLVGTPIGNLGDISARALRILGEVDFIAAEDTRVSRKLLQRYEIHRPLVSYHEHNRQKAGESILSRLLAGENCALITDAGMPCISDPGEDLVRRCAEHGIEAVVVPGPSAVISALALSGLPTGRFSFEGFLSVARGSRMAHLQSLREDPRTLVFYEAPHKLLSTLKDLLEVLGDRRIAMARELTKLHEEVLRTTLGEAVAYYENQAPRGEYVLVIEGYQKPDEPETALEDAVALARTLSKEGLSASAAAREAAARTGRKKGDIYRALTASTEEE